MTETQAPSERTVPVFVPDFCRPEHRGKILLAAILASSIGFIDGSVVAIALPAMRETLGASLTQAQWIGGAYMLALSAFILTGGAMGDRFGLARVFSAGIVLFVGASMVCAMAGTPQTLIWARSAQGLGAALMVPGSLAIIARAYPRAERGRAIGTWAAASAMTTAAGPLIGGLALTAGGPGMWRAIFAVNLPLGALALWLLWRGVARDASRPGTPVDLVGAGLVTLGLALLAWGLTGGGAEGGEAGGDAAAQILPGAVLAGLAVLGLFVWAQARGAHPMMPLGLFRSRAFAAANLMSLVLYFALSAILFFLPMTVIAGWGVSPAEASLAFLPLSVLIALLSSRLGRLADRIGPRLPLGAGCGLVAAGYAMLAQVAPQQEFWQTVLPAMCIVGLGMALVVAPLSAAVMTAVPDHQSGVASGVNNAVTRIAGLIAIASMGSLAGAVYGATGGPASFGQVSDLPGHAAATDSAFQAVAWISAGLSALAAAIALVGLPRGQASSSASQ